METNEDKKEEVKDDIKKSNGSDSIKLNSTNAQIIDIGLWYDGHGNQACCRICFKNIGGYCHIDFTNLGAFIYTVFGKDDDVDIENGLFVEKLKGKYVRVITDDNMKLVGIMHIIHDDTLYMLGGRK